MSATVAPVLRRREKSTLQPGERITLAGVPFDVKGFRRGGPRLVTVDYLPCPAEMAPGAIVDGSDGCAYRVIEVQGYACTVARISI